MKIRALNEPDLSESSSDQSSNDEKRQQKLSKEALEEQYFDRYKNALIAIQESRRDEALEALEELNDEFEDLDTDSESLQQLRFSVLKNLGNLDDDNIDHFIEAISIDSTDINLWMKAGDRSAKMKNLVFARYCYEQALLLNSQNWLAIDRLMELYYILHLPFELYDICSTALKLDPTHQKAGTLFYEAKKMQPSLECTHLRASSDSNESLTNGDYLNSTHSNNKTIRCLNYIKQKRRNEIESEQHKYKKARLSLLLDSARTQSLVSFGNYIVKIYERYSKQGITSNSLIDLTINSTSFAFSQQNNNSLSQYSTNQNSIEHQTTSSQDIDMVTDGNDGNSISDIDKSTTTNNQPNINNSNNNNQSANQNSNNTNNNTTNNKPSQDDIEQTKSSSRGNKSNQSASNHKASSLSFAAMLFPMDLGDKRRSSRNRSNQDDTFSFKMKFDELNELLPDCLRIGAIEQVLQQRREEQQKLKDSNQAAEKERQIEEDKKSKQEESFVIETNPEPMKEHHVIIKDVIESLVGSPGTTATKTDIKFRDMIFLYLAKVAANKQNSMPEPFIKLYKIYRKLCPLPTDLFVDFGPNGLTTEEIWFTLTANEITYQHSECTFLLRIIYLLQLTLDDLQHKEFLVRLFLILGLNHDSGYFQLALEAIEEGTRVYGSDRKIITRAYIKTLIDKTKEKSKQQDAQNEANLLEAANLENLIDESLDIINKLAPKSENEMSDREINLLCQAIKVAKVWQRGLDILNQRNDLNSDSILETINVCLKNGSKMDAILSSKLCKEAITNPRPTTWTCLYRGWCSVMDADQLEEEDILDKMSQFFELGHQAIGKKNCCTTDQGEFLMLYVKHLLHKSVDCEEKVIHGALSCLFNFPNKKPSFVVAHKATRVPITWDFAEIIYPFFEADELPTYMSLLRKVGISSETEPILKEIAHATPDEFSPKQKVHIIEKFIDSGGPLENIEISPHNVTKNVYYYLADYYFKNKEFAKAKEYYHYDLVINPDRFDSWAASGLIRANEVDNILVDGTISLADYVNGTFSKLVDSAICCFERATKLNPHEAKATLWVEFGNLTYNCVSLGMRLYVYEQCEAKLDQKPLPDMQHLDIRHQELYAKTRHCFESANTLCHSEEVWLHYYMLGKIAEKVDSLKALHYYTRADAQLFDEGASYPKKISYHNTPELAYEAMEVHYRIHSCALKYLFTSSDVTQENMNLIRKYLLHAQRSPFVQMESLPDPQKNMSRTLNSDVCFLIDDILDDISSDAIYDELIFMCLHGLKRCLIRCDKNFKALYRLAFYYERIRDPVMAQKILLAREIGTDDRIERLLARNPGVPEFLAAPPDLKGVSSLFKDRKIGNLFFNIWRIPVEEVDRPGCFEHWMFKCTSMLIDICKALNDTGTLNMIAHQLSKQPDMSKKYLQDRARILLARLAQYNPMEQSAPVGVDHNNPVQQQQ